MTLNSEKQIAKDEVCLNCSSRILKKFKALASDSIKGTFVNIIECRSCCFAWQYPISRSEEESAQFFIDAYSSEGKTGSNYFNPSRKLEIARIQLKFLEEVAPLREGGAILDIGAGAGIFAVASAEHGWKVTVVDPALEISNLKGRELVNFIKGTTANVGKGQLFDVVTMWDIIEHVADPTELILSAKSFLKPAGWLIIETGNYKSIERVQNGLKGWIYQLDHKWYFSPDSIKNILGKTNFYEMIFSDRVFRPGWNDPANYSELSLLNLIKSVIGNPMDSKRNILKYLELLKAKSREMSGISIFTVAARKGNNLV